MKYIAALLLSNNSTGSHCVDEFVSFPLTHFQQWCGFKYSRPINPLSFHASGDGETFDQVEKCGSSGKQDAG